MVWNVYSLSYDDDEYDDDDDNNKDSKDDENLGPFGSFSSPLKHDESVTTETLSLILSVIIVDKRVIF